MSVDNEKCQASGDCDLVCLSVWPTKVLAQRPLDPTDPSSKVLIQSTHPLLCDGCMECVKVCDHGAITVAVT